MNSVHMLPADPVGAPADEVSRGQAVYNRRTLAAYDLMVLGLMNHVVWRCPTDVLVRHYESHLGRDHIEVGAGTGYFLDRASFPVPRPQITLLDMNRNALAHAGRRLARFRPRMVRANALDPWPLRPSCADSVGLGYLLHCLPGNLAVDGKAIAHAARVVRDDGCVFGATILGSGVRHTWLSRAQLRWLNARGVFHNRHDDLAGLQGALDATFHEVEVSVTGAVARFAAYYPRRPGGRSTNGVSR
jgi:ubiquinone/menaquinone biosynthesis C-methylase UbiE